MLSIATRMKAVTVEESFSHCRRLALIRRQALAAISAVVTSAAIPMTSMALPAREIASASADSCPSVQVVFARGTGEPPGVGRVGQAFIDSLQPRVRGHSMDVYAIDYPASHDFLRAADGANDASTFIQHITATCPDTHVVLGGYSQGAAVMDIVTVASQPVFGFADPMPADVARHVAAVAVFGNPSNRIGGPLSALSPLYGDKTIDLCTGGDPVCSDGNDASAHSLYVESGMATQAATFVAQQLSAPTRSRQETVTNGSE